MKKLSEKDFEKALDSALITGVYILDEKYILDYSFKKLNFQNLRILNGSFACSSFQDCKFLNVIFDSVHLDHCDFKNCQFKIVVFKNCTTECIKFTNCTNMPTII